MSALETVVKNVQAVIRGVADITVVPDYVPESMNADLIALVYPSSGSWKYGAAVDANGFRARWGVHVLTIRVHVTRKDLPGDQKRLMPFTESIPFALLRAYQVDQLGGSVIQLGDGTPGNAPITYSFAPDQVADVQTLALTFLLTVQVEEEVQA